MKAQVFGSTVNMILLLAAAVVLIGFVGMFVANTVKGESIEACRLSFLAASYDFTGEVLDFDCPIREVSISKRDIYKGEDLKENTLNRILAEELRICNYMTAEAKHYPFDSELFSQNTACIICADISFDESISEDGRYTIYSHDVNEYLKSTILPKGTQTYAEYLEANRDIDFDKGITYIESIKKDTVRGTRFVPKYTNLPYVSTVDSNQRYFVVYQYVVPSDTESAWDTVVGWVTDRSTGPNSAIFLIDEENLQYMSCDMIAN
ncbi:hypothetical protein H6504_03500 [Candidatus Woesearchaeota archaeon]|nr:hypothetical protein [Candidatus Woesearchaeota archaeon]